MSTWIVKEEDVEYFHLMKLKKNRESRLWIFQRRKHHIASTKRQSKPVQKIYSERSRQTLRWTRILSTFKRLKQKQHKTRPVFFSLLISDVPADVTDRHNNQRKPYNLLQSGFLIRKCNQSVETEYIFITFVWCSPCCPPSYFYRIRTPPPPSHFLTLLRL